MAACIHLERCYNLGKNEGVFDAELYALYQAAKIFHERNENDQTYTILSDSSAASGRARSDEMGPGQRFAVTIIEVCSRLSSRGNTLTLRLVPSHLGIEGNEVADDWAKRVAGDSDETTKERLTPLASAKMLMDYRDSNSNGSYPGCRDSRI